MFKITYKLYNLDSIYNNNFPIINKLDIINQANNIKKNIFYLILLNKNCYLDTSTYIKDIKNLFDNSILNIKKYEKLYNCMENESKIINRVNSSVKSRYLLKLCLESKIIVKTIDNNISYLYDYYNLINDIIIISLSGLSIESFLIKKKI